MMQLNRCFVVVLLAVFSGLPCLAQGGAEDGNILVLHADKGELTIAPEIYGHFAEHLGRCIYDGIWVGEDSPIPNIRGYRKDIVEALKALNIPVLRWPGGCFADEYHWKDGIGPREQRPPMINTHWGMVTEDNSFGTHEFLDLCELLETKAYVAGNVGSGTIKDMQDWVEYMTFDGDSEMARLRRANGRDKPWRVRFFGVGNENWGCGGHMTPEYYADLYKRYQTYVRSYSGNPILKIACGPSDWNTQWMDVLLERAVRQMDGVSLHYYVFSGPNWPDKGSATEFGENDWFVLMKKSLDLQEILRRQIEVMDKYDRSNRVGLYFDEWGTWWNPAPGSNPGFLVQQNTLRDAVSAGIFLNIFNDHCERVKMANIAQTVNVLQAMVHTRDAEMFLTPTYHVFEMYKGHQGGTLLPVDLACASYEHGRQKIPALSVSASRAQQGGITLTLCHLNPAAPIRLDCTVQGAETGAVSGRVLTADAMNAHNTFEKPENIKPVPFSDFEIKENTITMMLPAMSVTLLEIE